MTYYATRRQLVTPGEMIGEGAISAGDNTYREGSRIFSSSLGLVDFAGNRIFVVPLKSAYIPRVDDTVIGRISNIVMSGWEVDIFCPYPAFLLLNETPAARGTRGPFARSDLSKIYAIGDLVIAQVIAADRTRDPLLTTKGRELGKVTEGRVIRVSPAKIPRIIGKSGSMISMLKHETGANIIASQNGVVLVAAKRPEQEELATSALREIDREAQRNGLTDEIKDLIRKRISEIGHEQSETSKAA